MQQLTEYPVWSRPSQNITKGQSLEFSWALSPTLWHTGVLTKHLCYLSSTRCSKHDVFGVMAQHDVHHDCRNNQVPFIRDDDRESEDGLFALQPGETR